MRPIPQQMREQMANDPFYGRCAMFWVRTNIPCEGRIEWHHCWIYAGKQINEPWAIVPACQHHHKLVDAMPFIKASFERISLLRATAVDLAKYPRKDWAQLKANHGV